MQRRIVPQAALEAVARVTATFARGARYELKPASELTPEELSNHHLIYLGTTMPLKNMAGSMEALPVVVDPVSGFSLADSQVAFHSEGNPKGKHRDHGFITISKSPYGKKRLLLSGTHRTSLIELSELLTKPEKFAQLLENHKRSEQVLENIKNNQSFTLAVTVEGIERTNLSTSIAALRVDGVEIMESDGQD